MLHQFQEDYKNLATSAKEQLDLFLKRKQIELKLFKENLPAIKNQIKNLIILQKIKQELQQQSLTSTNMYYDQENDEIISISRQLEADIDMFIQKKENSEFQLQQIIHIQEISKECQRIIVYYYSNIPNEKLVELYQYIENNINNRDLQFYFRIQRDMSKILDQPQIQDTKTDRLQQLDVTFEFLQRQNKKFKLTTFQNPPNKQYEILIFYDLKDLYWVKISQGQIQIYCKPNLRLFIINQLTNLGIDQGRIQQSIYELYTQQNINEQFIYDSIKRNLKEKIIHKYVSNDVITKYDEPKIEQYDYFLISKFV